MITIVLYSAIRASPTGFGVRYHRPTRDGVQVGRLLPPGQHQTGGEKRDLIEVVEHHCQPRVGAEDAYRPEGRDDADRYDDHVGDGRHRDGHSGIGAGASHPVADGTPEVGVPPRRQHDEHVVHSDTCGDVALRNCRCVFHLVTVSRSLAPD